MFNSYQYSGSFDELLKRMTRRARQEMLDDRIFELLRQFYEKELGKENLALSRPERDRLFLQVSKTILTDVLGRMGDTKQE